ncbi:hypothetical protein SDC9_209363 [bioreactor metagenome]|uniref:Uncharacterized protein n=1 Tax=bioreactor metagenome TaxID=1076179 RepID=A0A645JD31_9ZZZZ
MKFGAHRLIDRVGVAVYGELQLLHESCAGVFGVEVDLPLLDGLEADQGAAHIDFTLHLDIAVLLDQLSHHLGQNLVFGEVF